MFRYFSIQFPFSMGAALIINDSIFLRRKTLTRQFRVSIFNFVKQHLDNFNMIIFHCQCIGSLIIFIFRFNVGSFWVFNPIHNRLTQLSFAAFDKKMKWCGTIVSFWIDVLNLISNDLKNLYKLFLGS